MTFEQWAHNWFKGNSTKLPMDDIKDLEEWAIERMEWEYIYEVQT